MLVRCGGLGWGCEGVEKSSSPVMLVRCGGGLGWGCEGVEKSSSPVMLVRCGGTGMGM